MLCEKAACGQSGGESQQSPLLSHISPDTSIE